METKTVTKKNPADTLKTKAEIERKKKLYASKEMDFKDNLDKSKALIRKLEEDIKKSNDGFNDYRQIAIANEYLTMISLYIQITEEMVTLKGVRNETYLSEGRKAFYGVFLILEKIFTDVINLEPTEIQAKIEQLPKFDPARKIIFFRRMGFILDRLSESFTDKSKYKFSFHDMLARYAIIVKNSSNFKDLSVRDPRKIFFEENQILYNMLLDLLNKASDKLREKYEVSTKEAEDMKKAIRILEELKRIHTLTGETGAADEAKKKVDVWNDKLSQDLKYKEELAKKKK